MAKEIREIIALQQEQAALEKNQARLDGLQRLRATIDEAEQAGVISPNLPSRPAEATSSQIIAGSSSYFVFQGETAHEVLTRSLHEIMKIETNKQTFANKSRYWNFLDIKVFTRHSSKIRLIVI